MAKEICRSHSGREKIAYRSRAAAEKIARQSHGIHIRTYSCPLCGFFHITSQEPHRKQAPVISAGKLRRKMENYSREIAAQQRKLEAANRELARQQERAKKIAEQAAEEHRQTVAALDILVDRSFRMAGRK